MSCNPSNLHTCTILCSPIPTSCFCRYCVQETCNFDTLFSYLTCGNYDFRCMQTHLNTMPRLPPLQCALTLSRHDHARRRPPERGESGHVFKPGLRRHATPVEIPSLTCYCPFVPQLRPRRSIRQAMSHGERPPHFNAFRAALLPILTNVATGACRLSPSRDHVLRHRYVQRSKGLPL